MWSIVPATSIAMLMLSHILCKQYGWQEELEEPPVQAVVMATEILPQNNSHEVWGWKPTWSPEELCTLSAAPTIDFTPETSTHCVGGTTQLSHGWTLGCHENLAESTKQILLARTT